MPSPKRGPTATSLCAVMLACFLSALAATAGARRVDGPRLEQMAAVGLTDFEAKVKVVSADQTELARINRDFGMAYRLREVTMRYKEPNKLRMDNPIGQIIFNGSTRYYRVPALHISKREDLGSSRYRRYSLLDVGVITKYDLTGVESKYLREEMVDGAAQHVYELTFRGDSGARYVVWVNPDTRLITRRDWYDGEGKLRATFMFQEPREITPGLWFPMRIEIRNAENAVAAVTAYSDVKVNQGLDDALFQTSGNS